MIPLSFDAHDILTEHDDHLQLGEGNETTIAQYGGTTTKKWSAGLVEIVRGLTYRVVFWNSDKANRSPGRSRQTGIPLTKKLDAMGNTWYYRVIQQYTFYAITFFVIGHLFLGIGPYAVLPRVYGFIGIAYSVAINSLMIIHVLRNKGYVLTPLKFLEFVLYGDLAVYKNRSWPVRLMGYIPIFPGFSIGRESSARKPKVWPAGKRILRSTPQAGREMVFGPRRMKIYIKPLDDPFDWVGF